MKDRQISLAERVNQIERSGFTGGGTGSQQNLQETTGKTLSYYVISGQDELLE